MKVSKIELQTLIGNLKSFNSGSTFGVGSTRPFGPFDRALFVDMFRDSYFRIQRLYTAVNSAGLAINSMVNVLTSEMEKIQKDIENYEFFINNYNFLSGEDDLYNFNYLEKFNDLLGDYRFDGGSFDIPDRDGSVFPVGGNGFVDSTVGIFKFGSKIDFINVIDNIETINISSNYGNYISSQDDITNLFNDTLIDSWNVTVKSPTILTSNLTEYIKYIPYDYSLINGAQTFVEIKFLQSIVIDTIRLNPNTGVGFELLQVVLSDSEGSENILLNQSLNISGLKEFSFLTQSVKKIIFIFNQPSYVRNKLNPINSELNNKIIEEFISKRVKERNSRFSKNQDIVYWFFNKKTKIQESLKRNSEYDFYSYKFPIEKDFFNELIETEIFENANIDLDYKFENSYSPIVSNLIENMFSYIMKDSSLIKTSYFRESLNVSSQKLLDNPGYIRDGRTNNEYSVKNQFYNFPVLKDGIKNAINSMLVQEQKDFYEYVMSIRSIDLISTNNIGIGGATSPDKACFVSKKIPNNGQLLGVKAKIDIIEPEADVLLNFDLKNLLSYELSVSNVESADEEANWYPLSFNNQNIIDSEVVFFDITNMTYRLRFNPIQDSIFLYKDGMLCNPYKYSYSIQQRSISLLDRDLYSPSSVFCVKYTLDKTRFNPDEIDFVRQNLLTDDIRAFSNGNVNGQSFRKTDGSNIVILDRYPYLNRSLLTDAVYSPSLGTIFSATTGYSPVKVKLSDGSYAINLTNYTNSAQSVRFYDSSIPMFIQSGRNLVFDRSINSQFTVYYDYSPDTLRFRLIARRNIPNLNIPLKIDSVLLKMKTQSYDSYYEKLNLAFLGN